MKGKRKTFSIIITSLLSLGFLSACNSLETSSVNNSDDYLTCDDCNISNDYSSNDSQSADVFLEARIRQDFYLNDVHYVRNTSKELLFDDSYILLGYFVNACDLENWKSFDNNSSLVYAVEDNNTLVRNCVDDALKNRFELFSINISDAIGLKNNTIYIYEMEV